MKFGLEALQQICGQPTRPLEDCPTCRAIPDESKWLQENDDVKEDTIPPEADKLRVFILLDGTNRRWITRCADCGRIYWMTDEDESSATSSSWIDRTITRIDEVEKLLLWATAENKYKVIVREGHVWRAQKPGLWAADRKDPYPDPTAEARTDALPDVPRVSLGDATIPGVLYDLAKVLPTFEGDDLTSQLQTYDEFLQILSPVVRPEFVALFRKAAAAAQTPATRARLEAAANSVARGERAALPYDHAGATQNAGRPFCTLRGHGAAVRSVALSPDGVTVASASRDKMIKLWDTATRREMKSLAGHGTWINSVAFSPDGRILVSGSDDKTVKLWDIATGKELATLSGHDDEVMAVAFSPQGGVVASAGDDNKVRLWDAATCQEIRVLPPPPPPKIEGHKGRVNSISFGPDGQVLVSASDDTTIKLWDVETGREIRTLAGHGKRVNCVSVSPDGKLIASASDDATVKVWDVATGRSETLSGHEFDVLSVAFRPDQKMLASGSSDHTIKLWDVGNGKALETLSDHGSAVRSICFSSDGRLLASGSDDRTVKLWDATPQA